MLLQMYYLMSLTTLVGSGGEKLFIESDSQVNNNYTTTTGNNYFAISPLVIASGSTVTVTNGSTIKFF